MAIKASNQITIVDVTDAYSALLSSEGYTFVGNATGAPAGLSCTTQVTAYCGSQQCSKVSVSTIACPSGISANISDNDSSSPIITFTTTNTITETSEAIIPIVVDDITISKKFFFSVAKQGSSGADGKGIKSAKITYQISESGTTAPTGEWSEGIPETTSEKPYLWTRTVITYTDGTETISYSVSSTLDSVTIGGRNLVSEYDFTLTSSASSENAVSVTDDSDGNVTIISSDENIFTDDGSGNVTVTNSSAIGITDDGNGNVAATIIATSSTTYKFFIVDSGDAKDLTTAVDAAYDSSSVATRAGVYGVSIYNSDSDGNIGSIIATEKSLSIDDERHSCTMSISNKTGNIVAVKISMNNTDANKAGITINFSNLKIEKGNQATDWTPSPEDTEDAISEIRITMTDQKTEILSSCESIIFSALETYVESGEYDEFKQTVSSQLEMLADRITMTFSTVNQQVTDVDGDLQTKFNELYKYITFSGENAITIGSSDSSIKLIIDNDQILFTKDDVTFGSWDGNNFHTGNIIVDVNERAQFGNFAFLPNTDGSLSFVKVGG